MNIAIFGNGNMGQRIQELAINKGHNITDIASSKKPANELELTHSDVVIDFSTPSTAFENIKHAIKRGIPVVSGTTGWLEKINEIREFCIAQEGAFLYSSNFSLGMNLFFELNKQLATLMQKHTYSIKIHETHHKKKIDTPSGSSKTLAEDINKLIQKDIKIKTNEICFSS